MKHKYKNLKKCIRACQKRKTKAGHYPLFAFLELSNLCNIQCVMCTRHFVHHDGPKRRPIMNRDLMPLLEPFLPTLLRCSLMGNGEPLLNPHFLDFVALLKSHEVHVGFNTNGVLVDEKMAHSFLDHGVDQIVFSVDGANKESHERIRKGASFESVTGNVRRLKDMKAARGLRKPALHMETVVMKDNLSELDRFPRVAHDLGVTHIHFEPLIWLDNPSYIPFFNDHSVTTLDPDHVHDCFKRTRDRAEALAITVRIPWHLVNVRPEDLPRIEGNPAQVDPVEEVKVKNTTKEKAAAIPTGSVSPPEIYDAERGTDLLCTEPWTTLFITWDGYVRTCCGHEFSFGNLYEKPFMEIWDGREYRYCRKLIATSQPPPECSACLKNQNQPNFLRNLQGCDLGQFSSPSSA